MQRLPFLRPWGPIFQCIDNGSLQAQNIETWPFFGRVGTLGLLVCSPVRVLSLALVLLLSQSTCLKDQRMSVISMSEACLLLSTQMNDVALATGANQLASPVAFHLELCRSRPP